MNLENYTPTCELRWFEDSSHYDSVNDCFFKALQQKWIDNKGNEVWIEIQIVGR